MLWDLAGTLIQLLYTRSLCYPVFRGFIGLEEAQILLQDYAVILWCIQGQHTPVWAKAPHTLYKAVQFLWPSYSVFVSWMVLSATISHYCLPSKNRKSQMFRKEPLNASPFPLSQVQLALNNLSWTVRVYLTHEFF